ncbi:hypothetical protein KHQ81_05725 [Mycoplasmatota bacterium]|nr:hypothetical protein KHQ81_05725 [Mycoplasmatota bacterium]
MNRRKNAYIFYELLICFILFTTLIYFIIVPVSRLNINYENQKLTYRMKQTLYLNVVLLEDGETLTCSDTYDLKKEDEFLCIEWWDFNNEKRCYCEKVWL